MSRPRSSRRGVGTAVLLISVAVLALEILLLRVFALRWWHFFAHLVIATGLLGFGASGTALALVGQRFLARPRPVLIGLSVMFALATSAVIPAITFLDFKTEHRSTVQSSTRLHANSFQDKPCHRSTSRQAKSSRSKSGHFVTRLRISS